MLVTEYMVQNSEVYLHSIFSFFGDLIELEPSLAYFDGYSRKYVL